MNNDQQLKTLVQEKYSAIAQQSKAQNAASCCGATGCGDVYNIMADNYESIDGYIPDADLGLGCGVPTAFAQIKTGNTVIDLGSGAGNDAFVARKIVGDTGKVIGIDFTEAMIAKARQNADTLGYNNVEFRLGDIEAMPVAANTAHVIISNCVLNLIPNKANVFKEMYRVLKPGGHCSISDIVLQGHLPQGLQKAAEMYAGCVAGAIEQQQYLHLMEQAGFQQVTIQLSKDIVIPENILADYLSADEIAAYQQQPTPIVSITVYAAKPNLFAEDTFVPIVNQATACTPGGGCC
ncbi:MAG TPA: arsenite S-adenosylmethyltransferase [Chitinophagaceae bacterium]|nr:arsenite S-adenosylmethyltransferase [Chitinophagaceae bacterium]HAN37283.1 arsenite S-adenosylmethyltransferase [Chitinophagaceae bacterium]